MRNRLKLAMGGNRWLAALLVVFSLAACGHPSSIPQSSRALFDGSSLRGWSGDPRVWSVRDGAIVGSSHPAGRKENTFLIADGCYSDFVLTFEFQPTTGGSGIQIRSRRLPTTGFRVAGFQIDIGDGETGSFYEEAGRGVLAAVDPIKLRKMIRPGWNTLTIRAEGNCFEVRLNGHVTTRYTEPSPGCPRSGCIALQLQGGPSMEIAFRNIRIEVLDHSS
jgi:hypothetical protein